MHDPRLLRFLEVIRSSHELGTKDVAYILDCEVTVVKRLCATGEIECSWVSRNDRIEAENARIAERWKREGRQGPPPLLKRKTGKKHIWRVTAAALLAHIVTHTYPRTLLMQSIRELLPKWEAFAQRIASGATVVEAREQTAKKAKAANNAPNVLPFDESCDLFPQLRPATPSAA